MSLISLKNVSKKVICGNTEQVILTNVNLDIEAGDFVAIVGRSGSGKTTLLNILGCLDTDFSGEYSLNREDITTLQQDELAERRCRHFGFVFQRYNLLATLNSLDNVALPAIYAGEKRNKRSRRALNLLKKLGIENKQHIRPANLSGGEQQRISIARALMNKGNIILADEPTGALDTKNSNTVMNILKEQNKEGQTIILVTHEQDVASYANRVIEIRDGVICSESKKNCNQNTVPFLTTVEPTRDKHSSGNLFVETITMAVQSIRVKKLRSALTILGVIVGIVAVLLVMALGKGAQEKVVSDINKMGSDTIDVYPGRGFGDMQRWRLNSLTMSDVEHLKSIDYVSGVSPTSTIDGILVRKNKTRTILLRGVDSSYFSIKNLKKEQGRLISPSDCLLASSVVIINHNVKSAFFRENEEVLGKTIFFDGKPLLVVGILQDNRLQPDVQNGLMVFVPYSTLKHKIARKVRVQSIATTVKKGFHPQVVEAAINDLLLRTHGGRKDFFTFNSNTLQQAVEQATRTMTFSATCIALVSLIVGGIGVANIMLVSVTERVQEIGLRLAIGAKRKDILKLFLFESVILCFIGACIGFIFIFLASSLFENYVPNIRLSYTYHGIIMALVCSLALGILAGVVPARVASRLNPATALARE